MGFAILWVIFYHYLGKNSEVSISNLFFAVGHGGVDIFLFLSGFGLMFGSLTKNKIKIEKWSFYKKRIIRIFPIYILVILFFGFFNEKPISEILSQLLIFGFFIPGISSYDWYIPSLLILYIIFPFFFNNFRKRPIIYFLTAILFGLLITGVLIFLQKGTVILFFSRIPVFVLGCWFAYELLSKDRFKNWGENLVYISIIFLLGEMVLSYYFSPLYLRKTALSHLPFFLITPGLCLILGSLFEFFSHKKFTFYLLIGLGFIGNLSLEVYLIHMSLGYLPLIPALLITILASYFLSIGLNFVLKLFSIV